MGVAVRKLKPQLPRPAAPLVPAGTNATADQQSSLQQALAQQRALFPVVRREGTAAERAQISDDEDDSELPSLHEEDDDEEIAVTW